MQRHPKVSFLGNFLFEKYDDFYEFKRKKTIFRREIVFNDCVVIIIIPFDFCRNLFFLGVGLIFFQLTDFYMTHCLGVVYRNFVDIKMIKRSEKPTDGLVGPVLG
jgi:hypothetical protein